MRGWLERSIARQLVVHTAQGTSIKGFVDEVARDGVLLRGCTTVVEGRGEVALTGEVFVPRSQVVFTQTVD